MKRGSIIKCFCCSTLLCLGREFVAGSYDRTVRIFTINGGHSREVYHTKRMQRVFAVRFSGDASYVFSGECLACWWMGGGCCLA